MRKLRFVISIACLMVASVSTQADWQKVRISQANSTDWPPATMPETFADYAHLRRLDSLAYDPVRKIIVLFKGRRTFEYDGTRWTIKDAGMPGGPGHLDSNFPLWSPDLIYYPKLHGVFLYGGSTGYANANNLYGTRYSWVWDGQAWVPPPDVDYAHRPEFGSQAGTYDPVTETIVMFGGLESGGSLQRGTFIYDGTTWKKVTAVKPPPRIRAAMAYDERRHVIVLYGGYQGFDFPPLRKNDKVFADTWEWDGCSWKRVSNAGPGPRAGHSLVYLPELKRVVLFGGFSTVTMDPKTAEKHPVPHNDLWSWDGKRWTQLEKERPAPAPRYGHGATYDSTKQQMVIYGGEDGKRSFRDLWYYRARK